MIPDPVKKEILARIRRAEQEQDVRVLFAIESGSRAWGFASPNSDYDVRFVYAHPKDWYVAVDLEQKRDVIEYEIVDDIDINGWDARKALRLLWKSNPALIEWVQSPIVYVDDNHFAPGVRNLVEEIYSTEKGIYHYRSMAKTNYRGYLREELVPLKKYFYVLRPLLSIQWLEKYNSPAPIEFDKLRTLVESDSDLDLEITKLLERKKASMEKDIAPTIPALNRFIESELARLENFDGKSKKSKRGMEKLNALFHEIVG